MLTVPGQCPYSTGDGGDAAQTSEKRFMGTPFESINHSGGGASSRLPEPAARRPYPGFSTFSTFLISSHPLSGALGEQGLASGRAAERAENPQP